MTVRRYYCADCSSRARSRRLPEERRDHRGRASRSRPRCGRASRRSARAPAEERAATERASQELVRGLTDAMGLPAVRVEVLAARPHARWGELHGLYTARARPEAEDPAVDADGQAAARRRVPHVPAHAAPRGRSSRGLHAARLGESYHTAGVLQARVEPVPPAGAPRARIDDADHGGYAKHDRSEERLARLSADRRRARGRDPRPRRASSSAPARRQELGAPRRWSATCATSRRSFMRRFGMILAMDEPEAPFDPATPDRWAEERQYLRNDASRRSRASGQRRDEIAARCSATLTPEQWKRGGDPRHARAHHHQRLRGADGVARRQPPRPAQARARREGLIAGTGS